MATTVLETETTDEGQAPQGRDSQPGGTPNTNVEVPAVLVKRASGDGAGTERLRTEPIGKLRDDLVCMGMEPHLGPATLQVIMGLGRYAGTPCSSALLGPSGVGKTILASTTTKLLPQEDIKLLIEVTYPAMMAGFGWPITETDGHALVIDVRRKQIVLDENVDIRSSDPHVLSALRQATSTERTSRIKMNRGIPVELVLRGPLTLTDCRLDTAPQDYQTANRMVPIKLSDDTATLEAIARLTAEGPTRAGRERAIRRHSICAAWRSHIRSLNSQLEVVIEFADQLMFRTSLSGTARVTHIGRLYNALHAVISAVAWLRQHVKRRQCDPRGQGLLIAATREDYRLALQILREGQVLDERPTISAPALDVLRRWQQLAHSTGNDSVTAPGLYRQIGVTVDRGNMTRHIQDLQATELVVELANRNCNRQKLFQLTSDGLRSPTVNLLHTLPSPDSLQLPDEAESDAGAQHVCAGTAQTPTCSGTRS